jgi:hypothetical protein
MPLRSVGKPLEMLSSHPDVVGTVDAVTEKGKRSTGELLSRRVRPLNASLFAIIV